MYDERMKRYLAGLLALLLLLAGCATEAIATERPEKPAAQTQMPEDKTETLAADQTPEQVADYLRTHGALPDYYLTKNEARDLGWISEKGNLWDVAEGRVIGGDRFGNREGLLPDKKGRRWYEADVGYQGGFRGAERLVFSDDGLIYYTDDHYDSFEDWTEASP